MQQTSATTATARPLVPSPSPKKWNEDGYASGAFGYSASPWKRGPTKKGKRPYVNNKARRAMDGKSPYYRGQNDDQPRLFQRLSSPPPSPSGPLLGRIGGSARDEAALASSDRTDGEEATEDEADSLPSATSREVEQFLESVIGASSSAVPLSARTANKPSLALETNKPPVDHRLVKMEDDSSPMPYSPTQAGVSSAPPSNLVPGQHSHSLVDPMPPLSSSAVEECRKLLAPVLLASAQARDPERRLGLEQCLGLLSDDHCANFLRKAKEMRHQLSSLLPHQTSVNQGWGGESDGVDEVDAWVQHTHSTLSPVNTVVADVSRRDSDCTLVDGTGGKSPPGVPRAVLQSDFAQSAHHGAHYQTLVASPTTETPASASSLADPVYQAVPTYPALMSTPDLPMTEVGATHVSEGQPTADQPGNPAHPPPPIQPADPPIATDFVSHLPTEPGVWFRRRGRRFAEIVDVDIQVGDDMFYLSGERLRMHLCLCSVPVGALTDDGGGMPALRDAIDGVIVRRAVRWPKKGKLVVQVNPESERSKTWLPYALASEPLDVTACVRPGKNVVRFIQLADLSGFDFVLVASPPPPEEEWRRWDWASFVDARDTRTATDGPVNGGGGLSEFAHVPVIVRS